MKEEQTTPEEVSKYLNDLYANLEVKEKTSRIVIWTKTAFFLLIMSGAIYLTFMDKPNPDAARAAFMMIKFQDRLEELNQPINDSIQFYIQRIEHPTDKKKLQYFVNKLNEANIQVIKEFTPPDFRRTE